MKKLFLLSILIVVLMPFVNAAEEIRLIAKINGVTSSSLDMTLGDQSTSQVVRFADPKQLEVIRSLRPNDEVLLSGRVEQSTEPKADGIKLSSIFIIQEVRPISLGRLGNIDDMTIAEKPINLVFAPNYFVPRGIPVSKEVASSITITASLLLLRSLAATPAEPEGKGQLNEAVIFSAGVLATGLFIWEQITEKVPKN